MSRHDRKQNDQPAAEKTATVTAQGETTAAAAMPNGPASPAEIIAAALKDNAALARFVSHFPLEGVRIEFIDNPTPGQPYGEGKKQNTVPVRMAEVFLSLDGCDIAIPCGVSLEQGPDKEGRCRILTEKKGNKVALKGENPEYDQVSGRKNRGFKFQYPSRGTRNYYTPFFKTAGKGSAADQTLLDFGELIVDAFFLPQLAERTKDGKQNPINWNVKTVASVEGAGVVTIGDDDGATYGID